MTARQRKFSWQDELAQMVQSPEVLLRALNLSPEQYGWSVAAHKEFPLKVTHSYLARMEKGNPQDPLLLQVLPKLEEMQLYPGYSVDPLEEKAVSPVAGLLHKYHGRALWVMTSPCAIHCRYCFRRHFPYPDHHVGQKARAPVLAYLREHPEIHEVILSGGEPLSVPDDYLRTLLQELESIPHLQTLRFHSRIPIVLPSRMTDEFLDVFAKTRLHKVMVVHANHPQEINQEVEEACQRLDNAGWRIFNQSVLLKKINDEASILAKLSHRLFQAKVLPYYLHQLDKVNGSAHFEVSTYKAKKIYHALKALLPGYLVPKLVVERAGAASKIEVY